MYGVHKAEVAITAMWTTFSTYIRGDALDGFSWQIPVSVTSLKSTFFTLTSMKSIFIIGGLVSNIAVY